MAPRLVALPLLLLVAWAVADRPVLRDTDFDGPRLNGRIAGLNDTLPAASAALCAALCEAQPLCAGAVWNGPQSQWKDRGCNLHCSTMSTHAGPGELAVVVHEHTDLCDQLPPAPPAPAPDPHEASSSNGADGVRFIGNFGLSAVGAGLERLSINPSVTDQYLTSVGAGTLYLTTASGETVVADNETSSVWPELALPPQHGLAMTAFAPLSPRNSSLGFLPVVVMRWTSVANDRGNGSAHVAYVFDCDPRDISSAGQPPFCPGFFASSNAPSAPCSAAPPPGKDMQRFCLNVSVSGTGTDLVIGYFTNDGVYATPGSRWNLGLTSADALSAFVLRNIDMLEREHRAFVSVLPKTGEAKTDASIRWFTESAVLLTKGAGTNVLTMGYVELNQRDSFWTSWLHVRLWPDIDLAILQETAANQCGAPTARPPGACTAGKIPTTILPDIIRGDNVDVTAYYIVRAWRHYSWTRDKAALASLYPSLVKAAEYLESRDIYGVGVPAADNSTFWADWKDVAYVQNRTYAPHFDMLYAVAMNATAQMATVLSHNADAAHFRALAAKAIGFVNRDATHGDGVSGGGLWNGSSLSGHYIDVWNDNRQVTWVLEDQVEAVFHDAGVVPKDRIAMMFDSFDASGSEGAYGVRETFPYIDPNVTMGQAPGCYHNGGIWPWLNCVDAVARMEHGRVADGQRIFAKMSNRMLYNQPDGWVPAGGLPLNYEWMHGETGADNGGHPQGWNAACVMVGWRGHFGLRRRGHSEYSLHVRGVMSSVSVLPLAPEHGYLRVAVTKKGAVRVTQLASPSGPPLGLLDVSARAEEEVRVRVARWPQGRGVGGV